MHKAMPCYSPHLEHVEKVVKLENILRTIFDYSCMKYMRKMDWYNKQNFFYKFEDIFSK